MAEERVSVSPEVLKWAFRRIGKQPGPNAPAWVREVERWPEDDERPTFKKPTFTQVINLARKSHLPLDHFLRDKPPPRAKVFIPDMRAIGNAEVPEPSLNMLAMIHLCQLRQEWYKDYLHSGSDVFYDFVSSASLEISAEEVAASMRDKLSLHEIPLKGSWKDSLKALTEAAEDIGILVMRSSMVHNSHHMLNPQEFSGIALADEMEKEAPVIFINSAAAKGTLAFTFAHELAHIWLGVTALSGGKGDQYLSTDAKQIEQWCARAATQFLAPAHRLTQNHHPAQALPTKLYKVSEPVIGRYDSHTKESDEARRGNITPVRAAQVNGAGRQLCQAAIASLNEGKITHREAYKLLDVSNTRALRDIGNIVGVRL